MHTQGLASTIWTVTHNFGNKNLIFFVYDSNDQLVTAQISNVTDNSFDVNLTNAITGRVVVFGGTDQFVNAIQASSITVGTVQITGTGIIVNGIDIIAQLNTKANKNGDSTQDFSVKQLSVAGNIVPAADVTYDLGTPTNRFKDLYLSGSTIFIGGGSISFNSTTNKFSFFDDSGSTPAVLSLDQNTTDDLAEGTTNLYHTASRVIGVVNTLKGQAGGLAPLNASARIDSTYLPEYLTGSLEGSVSGSSGTLIDDAFPTTAARSAEFLVQVTQGTKHEVLKLLVLHDGTAAMVTEYGRVSTAATDVSFDATISGGNVTLTAQLGTAASTVIKFKRMAIAP